MISRHWKGLCKPEFADRYVEHLKAETFPQLVGLPGFVRATLLRRVLPRGVEFQVVTLWQSLAAIEAFAGEDVERAVVPESVQAMMLRYDHRVAHYEIAYEWHDR
jgi:heme-degrading monooxygenase HmoA